MKTITRYGGPGRKDYTIEFDETRPCIQCGEPVEELSCGGPSVCPGCDMGVCRYCGAPIFALKEEIDGGCSLREVREHMDWHKEEGRIE